jgi:hypothetical protein
MEGKWTLNIQVTETSSNERPRSLFIWKHFYKLCSQPIIYIAHFFALVTCLADVISHHLFSSSCTINTFFCPKHATFTLFIFSGLLFDFGYIIYVSCFVILIQVNIRRQFEKSARQLMFLSRPVGRRNGWGYQFTTPWTLQACWSMNTLQPFI